MEYVKICGLKKPEEISLCAEKGANAVGFIYNVPSSPRNLKKTEINNLLNNISNEILTVVVSKPRSVDELKKIVNDIKVNYYQIHSNMNIEELRSISKELKEKIILALKLNHSNLQEIIIKINELHDSFFAILIDNSEGHGNKLEISIIKELMENISETKIILAGGISIDNIEDIIKKLKPYGIDVSSSLESKKGVKNPIKIKKFLDKIKEIKKKI
ncbi:MAG: phosphoribosylanthranilate isomerase [Promethearchaeota archaeon]